MTQEMDKPYFKSSDGSMVMPIAQGGSGNENIVFRPQNLQIRLLEVPPMDNTIRLDGEVVHKEFLGSIIRCQVRVGSHNLLVDAAHQRGEASIVEEAKVALYLSNDQVIGLS